MSSLGSALRALDAALAAEGVEWFVFGAQAVAVHGAPRATQDVDVTVVVEPSGREAIVARLLGTGFAHRFPSDAARLLRAGSVAPLRHSETGFEVDVIFGGTGIEALFARRASRHLLDGVSVPVVSATDLVVMKVLAGRPLDLEDARGLLASSAVDRGAARDLLGQFEQALDRSDLVTSFDGLLPGLRR